MARVKNQQFIGKVEQIGIFPIKDHIKNAIVQSGPDKGKQFNLEKTHTIAFKIPDLHPLWIIVGHRKMRQGFPLTFWIKEGDEYLDVWNGSEVTFTYTKNDAGYIQIQMSTIRVLDFAPCEQEVYYFESNEERQVRLTKSSETSNSSVGAINGNAFNCSMILCKDNDLESNAFDYAMEILKINGELKEEVSNNGPAVGMAILSACKQTMDITKVKSSAKRKLEGLISDIDKRHQGDSKEEASIERTQVIEEVDTIDLKGDDVPF